MSRPWIRRDADRLARRGRHSLPKNTNDLLAAGVGEDLRF